MAFLGLVGNILLAPHSWRPSVFSTCAQLVIHVLQSCAGFQNDPTSQRRHRRLGYRANGKVLQLEDLEQCRGKPEWPLRSSEHTLATLGTTRGRKIRLSVR